MNYKSLNWKRRKGEEANKKFASFGTKQFLKIVTDDSIEYYSKPLRASEETEWDFETRIRLRRINEHKK